jgi:hypothetical protein
MKHAFALFRSSLFLAASFCAFSLANPAPPSTAPAAAAPAVQLHVEPARLPAPALKYALVPEYADQTPENAGPLYLMALEHLHNRDDGPAIDDLLLAPREKFSAADAEKILAPYQSWLALIDVAARRDRCYWGVPMREQGFAALLPFLNHSWGATRLLSLQARVQIAQGRFDDALHTLQTGFGMVEHIASDAALVQGLVAMGIANTLLERVEDFVEAPGAPNLYWALAQLPRPLADMRAMTAGERAFLEFEIPELRGRTAYAMNGSQLMALIKRVEEEVLPIMSHSFRDRGQVALNLLASDPPGRKWLIEHGHDPQKVKEMPTEQVVGLYFIETSRRVSDEMCKPAGLPYWQARPGYEQAVEKMGKARSEEPDNPLLHVLPALHTVHRKIARADRRIAMLQTLEALRGYAAVHGRLPVSLADLTETPAPMDPMTGTSFDYTVLGDTCTLVSQAPLYRPGEEGGTYKMTLRRKQ